MRDIFVSYNKADRAWATWVARTLQDSGYSVVIQEWDFRPGDHFVLKMHEALTATKTVLILSNDYLGSSFAASEWAGAFATDPDARQRKIVPVKVRECEPQGLLKALVSIDLVGLGEEKAKEVLRRAFVDLLKPSQNPGSPADQPVESVTFPGALTSNSKTGPALTAPAEQPSTGRRMRRTVQVAIGIALLACLCLAIFWATRPTPVAESDVILVRPSVLLIRYLANADVRLSILDGGTPCADHVAWSPSTFWIGTPRQTRIPQDILDEWSRELTASQEVFLKFWRTPTVLCGSWHFQQGEISVVLYTGGQEYLRHAIPARKNDGKLQIEDLDLQTR